MIRSSLAKSLKVLEGIKIDEEHNMLVSDTYDVDAMMYAINTAKLIIRTRIAVDKIKENKCS